MEMDYTNRLEMRRTKFDEILSLTKIEENKEYYRITGGRVAEIIISEIQIIEDFELRFLNHESNLFPVIRLVNCKLKSVNLNHCTIGTIIISHTSLTSLYINLNCSIADIYFQDKSACDQLNVRDSKIREIWVKENSRVNGFQFYESNISKLAAGETCKIGSMHFSNNSRCGYLGLSTNIEFPTGFMFQSSFIGYLSLVSAFVSQIFIFPDCVFGKIKLNSINFWDGGGEIKMDKVIVAEMTIGTMNNLSSFLVQGHFSEVNFATKKPINILFNSTVVEKINFTNTILPKETTILFNDCITNTILFDSSVNYGNIHFKNLIKTNDVLEWQKDTGGNHRFDDNGLMYFPETNFALLKVHSSDLGKTVFIDCNFVGFEFEFYNSKMLEIFISGTVFPNKVSVGPSIEKLIGLQQQRLAYSQIKKVFENRGDNVSALQYRALELETYRQELLLENTKSSRGEKINLWMHRFSNYYGTNWVRPIWVTIILGIVLFSIYCLILGNKPGLNIDKFFDLAKSYPDFLNPLHKSDELEKKVAMINISSFWYFIANVWEYFCRIIIAFLIYQVVQAFRKHGKSTS
jgi:hypothetical protein